MLASGLADQGAAPELTARVPRPRRSCSDRWTSTCSACGSSSTRSNLPITAIPGGGLLGDLLCGITNLLNPPALAGSQLAAVLNSLLALVPTAPAAGR